MPSFTRRRRTDSANDLLPLTSSAAHSLAHAHHRHSSSSARESSSADSTGDSDDVTSDDEGVAKPRAAAKGTNWLLVGGAIAVFLLIAGIATYTIISSTSPSESTGLTSVKRSSTAELASSVSGTTSASSSEKSSSKATASATASASTASATVKAALATTPSNSTGWLPVEKVRGVNLGSLFIFEPWMASSSWSKLGCSDYESEWECIEALGLDTLQSKFEEHWSSFYSADDFEEMASYGLNMVRVPLGYWTVDALIKDDEYFPRGAMKYVKQVVRWAKDASIFVILDLHGAPGSQTSGESFTGHKVDTPGFYTDENFQRAYDCLTNWTTLAHTDADFSSVVAIHVVNEPKQDSSLDIASTYYPGAQKAIRDAEAALGIVCTDDGESECLVIQFMDNSWGSGNPSKHINTTDHIMFDDHNYVQWIVDESDQTREGYLDYVNSNTRSTDTWPVIIGEWSLSTIGGDDFTPSSDGALEFFQAFAKGSIIAAEKGVGQTFWSWKTELDSSQWGYKDAVEAGFIPKDLSTLYSSD
ncbi:hypothetical protein JCM10207_000437 [Rhodosporidiobolus poonsookiae]